MHKPCSVDETNEESIQTVTGSLNLKTKRLFGRSRRRWKGQ